MVYLTIRNLFGSHVTIRNCSAHLSFDEGLGRCISWGRRFCSHSIDGSHCSAMGFEQPTVTVFVLWTYYALVRIIMLILPIADLICCHCLYASFGRCRQVFRGHMDSVNSVAYQPYSGQLVAPLFVFFFFFVCFFFFACIAISILKYIVTLCSIITFCYYHSLLHYHSLHPGYWICWQKCISVGSAQWRLRANNVTFLFRANNVAHFYF